MRLLLFVLLVVAAAAPAAGRPLQADTTLFVVDSTRSGLRFSAQLRTPFGSASDSDSSAITGTVGVVLEPAAQGGTQLRIPAFRLVLAGGMHFVFEYGFAGSIVGDSQADSLALVLRQPGPPSAFLDSTFALADNDVAMEGAADLRGTGALGLLFPPTHQAFDIEAAMALGGTLRAHGRTYTLDAPVHFTGAFELGSNTTLDVTLTGRVVATGAITTGREPAEAPGAFALSPAYPNPFNPSTTLTLALDRPQHVRLAVYDLLGREVALLHDGYLTAAGAHRFTLDGAHLPSGTFVVRALGERHASLQRIVLVK